MVNGRGGMVNDEEIFKESTGSALDLLTFDPLPLTLNLLPRFLTPP